jgi:predicted membrane protein DUF2339
MKALAVLGVLVGVSIAVLPFVAFGLVLGARKRIRALEIENAQRRDELRWLSERLEGEKKAKLAVAPAPLEAAVASAAAAPAPPSPAAAPAPPTPAAAPAPPTAAAAPAPPTPAAAPAPPRPAAASASAASAASTANATSPGAPIGAGPGARTETPAVAQMPIEQRIANWVTRMGAVALLFAVLYFYKYAVDNAWIGPAGRVLIGVLLGVAILAFAEIVRAKTKPAYVQILCGVGLAALYISAYASSAFYHLVDVTTAFAANAVILLLGAALAWRHRGEAVLIVVLVAGFLNPVLLSTGVDRPAALFTYLFLLTTVTLFVSVKRHFQIALPISIVGVVALFVGWYGRFFEVYDHRGLAWAGDRPPEELVGAYHELANRTAPISAVAAFTAEWLGLAFTIKKDAAIPRWAKPVAIAALILSHGGLAALLYDHVRILGGAMIVLGVTGVLTLRALGATRFLLVPLLAAFAILSGTSAASDPKEHLVLLVLLGVWSAIYVVAFLRDAAVRTKDISRAEALRASIAIYAFAILAAIVLVPHERCYALGAVMIAASALLCFLSHRAKSSALVLVSLLLTLTGMAIGAAITDPDRHVVSYAYLGLILGWAAVYFATILVGARGERGVSAGGPLGGLAEDARSEAESPRLDGTFALVLLSISSLAFLGLTIGATSDRAPTLRALLTGFTGILDLGFALFIKRARRDRAQWVTVLAAEALALFAPALAFGFSGATITVVWAVLALVAFFILADSKARAWLVVAIGLSALVLIRVFAFDIADLEAQLDLFQSSYGRSGILRVPFLFNARAYALVGAGASFLAGAFLLARAAKAPKEGDPIEPRGLLIVAPVLAAIAHGLLIAFAVTEIRGYLLDLPPAPPMPLDFEEFNVLMESVREAKGAQHMLIAMSTTVVLASSAMILLGIGFIARDPFHRWLGLLLFLGTVVKLGAWDVWNLPRVYQIVVFGVVGAIALAAGFLYARLKVFFKAPTAAASAGVLALSLLASPARADESKPEEPSAPSVKVHLYKTIAPISGVNAAGDHRLVADLDLYRRSLALDPLADIRIADDKGKEVPYLVRPVLAQRPVRNLSSTMFDPGEIEGGGSRATFEISPQAEHCQVDLSLASGSGTYLHRTKIETGEKLRDLQTISQGALVYQIAGQSTSLSGRTIRYPTSIARYVRITLLADPQLEGRSTRIEGATFSCTEPPMVEPQDRLPLKIVSKAQNKEQKTTELELDAGDEGVPIQRLHLKISGREFVRRVEVQASSFKSAWPIAGSDVIYRVGAKEGPEQTAIALREPVRKRWFRVIVHDADDAPIDISAVEGSSTQCEILFRTRRASGHTLYIGDKDGSSSRPYYDLSSIAERRTEELDAKPAQLGPLSDNPAFGKEHVADDLPATEKHRPIIAAALAAVLLGLGVWAVRLIRRG